MNFFIPNVEEFFETILSLFNQSNACLEIFALKKRLDNFVVWRAVGSGNLYSHSCCLGWILQQHSELHECYLNLVVLLDFEEAWTVD